jgi:hypothetical protein
MIISHKHKFIFFKTRKTAGSSLQVALAQHCGPDDIITGQYRLGVDDNSHSAGLNMDRFFTNHPHPELEPVKSFVGQEIWNSYFKFAIVRNPFDIAVSRYHWNKKGKVINEEETSVKDFQHWVESKNLFKEDSLLRYTCSNGRLDLDFIGHYETLEDDVNYICDTIGIPSLELPTLKGGFRDKKHYSEFYNESIRKLVEDFYATDLKLFGYSFKKDFEVKSPKPIIDKNLTSEKSINGPSLIKVPETFKNRLGKYYLYFAHHDGVSIKMAYSDNLEGPWTLYKPGTLHLSQTPCKTHIASPDVHIKDDSIVMYYHGDTDTEQLTFRALSYDGLSFKSENKPLGMFYFRVFDYLGETYSIAKDRNISGILYKMTKAGDFEPFANLIDKIRHSAVYVEGNELYIFYSVVGEAPESLYVCKIVDWEVKDNYKLRQPKYRWEGSNRPLVPSSFGMPLGFVNQLRDPCIFVDKSLYLLYSYGGEAGIAISKLEKL